MPPHHQLPLTEAASERNRAIIAAYDEATDCLSKGDFGGFDAAMRLYRKFSREAGGANNAPASDQ